MTPPRVELSHINKSYSGVQVLHDVSLSIEAAAIHGLIGENGAGKSTLVKILTGVIQPDNGTMAIDGQPRTIPDPSAAYRLGISAMFQEAIVFPDLSVAENLFVGRRPTNRLGLVDWKTLKARARALLDELDVGFGLDTPVRELGVADRQLLEIAKALSANARLLIMDEPTASLSPNEVERLFETVRGLRDRGVSVLFISHRLEEVSALVNMVTVLRDGHHVATHPISEVNHAHMIRLMVGRTLEQLYPKTDTATTRSLLEVRGFSRRGVFADVSFQVHAGEIVGLAGFVGAGRSEVAWSLFGVEKHDGGEIMLDGASFIPGSTQEAMERGIAYLPEDRLSQGLIAQMPIVPNLSLAVLRRLTPGGWLRGRAERKLTERFMHDLHIRANSPYQIVQRLSGGNQQKVVLSKWLATEPKVLILDEPTRGVDVGTKADVYRIIFDLASRGLGILLISSELPEILGLSDRVLVMREGRLVAEFDRADATEQKIIAAAAGMPLAQAPEPPIKKEEIVS